MSYKILDFCQILNKGLFSYFTSVDGDFLSRGNNQPKDYLIHQDALLNLLNQTSAKLWVENNCIHFNLPLYGFFTIGFDENTGLQQETYILEMVVEFLSREGSSARNDANRSNAAIFSLLHTNMQEMNKNQFRLSNLAIDVVKKLMNSLQIDEGKKEILLNICSVFPYDFDYLKKHISHTNEWQFLLEIGTILHEKGELKEYRIEVRILAFIYKMVIQGKKNDKFEFLNEDLRELCFSTYEASLKSISLDEVTLEVDHKQIEDITDLKSVISTLALTAREKEILYLIIEGLNNHELGQYLNISVHTVKNHVTNIFKKLNVTDRIQAMAKIYRIKFEES